MEVRFEKPNRMYDVEGLCQISISKDSGYQQPCTPHFHQYYELLYVIDGSYELHVNNEIHILTQNSAVLIHQMDPHWTRTLTPNENIYIVLKFLPEILYTVNQPVWSMRFNYQYHNFHTPRVQIYSEELTRNSPIKMLLDRILSESEQRQYGFELSIQIDICRLFLWFLRDWHIHSKQTLPNEKDMLIFQKTHEYIEQNLCSNLSVKDVAKYLYMGSSTFSRFFSRVTSMSFPSYVRNVRLKHALSQLLTTSKTITEIAMDSGFCSSSHMISSFKKAYNVTPAKIRQK